MRHLVSRDDEDVAVCGADLREGSGNDWTLSTRYTECEDCLAEDAEFRAGL